MANNHGGPRTPDQPAPVSGPGKMARRTDGGPAQKLRAVTGLPYGENSELNTQQAAAPLAQSMTSGAAAPAPATGPSLADRVAALTPFGAPTQRPNEPVTAGAALGPGPGPEALGLPTPPMAGYQSALSAVQGATTANSGVELAGILNQIRDLN